MTAMQLRDGEGNFINDRPSEPKIVVDSINETVDTMSTQVLDNKDGSQWILLETIMEKKNKEYNNDNYVKLEIYNNMSLDDSSPFILYLRYDELEDIKKPAYQAAKSRFVSETIDDISRIYGMV